MLYLNRKFLSLALALLLCACGQDAAWIDEPQAPKELSSLTAAVKSDAIPNSHSVVLCWTGSTPEFINRTDDKGVCRLYSITDGDNFVDADVVPGATYTYSTKTRSNDAPEASTSIQIPKDSVWSPNSPPNLNSVHQYKRLFIQGSLCIQTNAQPFSLEVDELVCENATINSSTVESQAALGSVGLTAGSIQIKAKRASGNLKIIANGQNGGDGAPGTPGAAGKAGEPGVTGQLGLNPDYLHRGPENDPYRARSLSDAARNNWDYERLHKSIGSPIDHPLVRERPYSFAPDKPGTRGADGDPGSPGTPGALGGDAGQISVLVDEDSSLVVEIENNPGLGGRGGEGGPGGEGGAGGAAGTVERWKGRFAPAGAPGSRGPQGRAGRDGESGRKHLAVVKIGSRIIQTTP